MSDNQNPLLLRLRMPGSTFRMPSHGIFYTNDELDESVKNGEVEVYPMTAMDEIILNTPDKLLSGKALAEIIQRCIPQIKKPFDLLAKDVDFLMVALRAASFGDEMEVPYKHTCDDAKVHTYKVNLQDLIRKTKAVDPTLIAKEYQVTMENGQQVTLKPLSYGDIVDLYQTTAMTKTSDITADEAEHLIINTLVSVIRTVDDIPDRALIREWVANIPLGWKKKLEESAQSVTQWGVDFLVNHRCKDCKEKIQIAITANPVSFFM